MRSLNQSHQKAEWNIAVQISEGLALNCCRLASKMSLWYKGTLPWGNCDILYVIGACILLHGGDDLGGCILAMCVELCSPPPQLGSKVEIPRRDFTLGHVRVEFEHFVTVFWKGLGWENWGHLASALPGPAPSLGIAAFQCQDERSSLHLCVAF